MFIHHLLISVYFLLAIFIATRHVASYLYNLKLRNRLLGEASSQNYRYFQNSLKMLQYLLLFGLFQLVSSQQCPPGGVYNAMYKKWGVFNFLHNFSHLS